MSETVVTTDAGDVLFNAYGQYPQPETGKRTQTIIQGENPRIDPLNPAAQDTPEPRKRADTIIDVVMTAPPSHESDQNNQDHGQTVSQKDA